MLRYAIIEGKYGVGFQECVEKQLYNPHDDQNRSTGCFIKASKKKNDGPSTERDGLTVPQELTGLWPDPPPQKILLDIKKKKLLPLHALAH